MKRCGLVRNLKPQVDLFKVGPVLFLKYGGALLLEIRELGAEIFLDLKFHDIPSVVAKAIERAGEWGVYSATIHTSGGFEMMKEAARVSQAPEALGRDGPDQSGSERFGAASGITRPVKEQVAASGQAGARRRDWTASSLPSKKPASIKKACGHDFKW